MTDLVTLLAENTRRSTSGCLEWTRGRDADGYAIWRIDGRARRLSRVLWAWLHGPIPPGLVVRHTCDNPPCLEPTHLLIGTHRDNVRDRVERGRSDDRRGDRCPTARLNWPQAREIRQRVAAGERHHVIAADFGVSRRLVGMIGRNERWVEAQART